LHKWDAPTTTALNVIFTKNLIPFFINCSEFDVKSLSSGSNLLLEKSIREINLLENLFPEFDLEFAYKLSGSTLSELLENSKDYLIIGLFWDSADRRIIDYILLCVK
jgi:hypothetical protein